MESKSIEEMIYEETEKRLKIMEDPGYEFPGTMKKADYVGIVASIVVSVVLIVCCVTGVIV